MNMRIYGKQREDINDHYCTYYTFFDCVFYIALTSHSNLFICMIACIFIGLKPFGTHGMVFMICGIFTRWKQIMAYYYIPDGFDGALLKEIILKIIEKAVELIGLKLHSVSSDIGATNQAMWKAFEHTSASK